MPTTLDYINAMVKNAHQKLGIPVPASAEPKDERVRAQRDLPRADRDDDDR
jgi:hypothetical protein